MEEKSNADSGDNVNSTLNDRLLAPGIGPVVNEIKNNGTKPIYCNQYWGLKENTFKPHLTLKKRIIINCYKIG